MPGFEPRTHGFGDRHVSHYTTPLGLSVLTQPESLRPLIVSSDRLGPNPRIRASTTLFYETRKTQNWPVSPRCHANSSITCKMSTVADVAEPLNNGREDRDRTCDLMLPKHALYHLSYFPKLWSPGQDSNLHQPKPHPVTFVLVRSEGGYQGINWSRRPESNRRKGRL